MRPVSYSSRTIRFLVGQRVGDVREKAKAVRYFPFGIGTRLAEIADQRLYIGVAGIL